MSAVSFRTPEEDVNYLKSVTELVEIFKSFTDPNLGTKLADLKSQISATEALSDAKKQQVLDAEEKIAQARDLYDDLEDAKKKHFTKVTTELNDVETKRNKLNSDLSAFAVEKTTAKINFDKARANAETLLASAKSIATIANAKEVENDKKIKLLTQMAKDHEDKITATQAKYTAEWDNIASIKIDLETKFKKLNEDIKLFEARKQKFDAAVREA